mmetsp:Transcript_14975/g.19431  ORF Transcript_14975/g.19431 Transcript_14975/m.19431 type:complete len:829 (+) Transcript_14975:21-2507(+)
MATPQSPTSGKPTYFTDQKKGEVNELRMLLKNINVERDPKRKRDVIKKVIAYMTLGIDVSKLFNEMVLCVETRDLVVKKMVYLYLVTYAQEHPEMALMCTNTLHRDCNDQDPMVRGMALRSLCSIRIPSMIEYISEPLQKSLADGNAYVRKTGVMGVLKLFNLDPETVKNSNMIDLLYNMIQDVDGGVVANCIMVLNEIMLNDHEQGCGGMAVNQALIHHLLGRLNDFNEWGLHQVLELTTRYAPADDQEVFNIMNLLDPVLRTSNSAVVLATIKVFLHLTKNLPTIQAQLFERLKNPVLTLLASGSFEIVYCVLKHIDLLVFKCPGIFDNDYKQFYIKFDEPLHIKYLKIDLLAQLNNSQNMVDILEELAVYVAEVDQELSRRSIRAIGKVGFKLPASGQLEQSAIDKLIEFLDLDGYIQAESVQVLVDMIRKNPHRRAGLLPLLPRLLRDVTEPQAVASLIWILGEYGSEIPEAPYLLENVIDTYEEETSNEVKLALLTASVKVFFQRPPEMHAMLGRLMLSATNEGESQDVRDRSLFYYRLLRNDVNSAKTVVLDSGHRQITAFAEDQEVQIKDALFHEFNSLSIIYSKLQRHFIAPDKRPFDVSSSSNHQTSNHQIQQSNMDASSSLETPPPSSVEAGMLPMNNEADVSAAIYGAPVDLLGNDLLSMGLSNDAPIPTPVSSSDVNVVGSGGNGSGGNGFILKTSCDMSEMRFQELWQMWSEANHSNCPMNSLHKLQGQGGIVNADACSEHLNQSASIFTMASGDMPDTVKLFLYAESTSNELFLSECTITVSTSQAEIVIKTAPENTSQISKFLETLLQHMNTV